MTVGIRGTIGNSVAGANTAGATLTVPAGAQSGDYILIAITSDGGASGAFTLPSGFTRFIDFATIGSRRFDLMGGWYTGQTTISVPSANNAGTRVYAIVVISGLPAGTPPTAGSFMLRANAPSPTTTTTTAPGVSVPTADSMVLAFFPEATTATTNEPGSVTTNVGTIVNCYMPVTESITIVRLDVATPATTPNIVVTYPNVQAANGAGIQLVFSGTPAVDPRGAGLPLHKKTVGGLVAHRLFVKSASGVRTPSQLVTLPRGYASVAAMLASTEFYVAHRGGSISWPEMSLHAYTQSVIKGYGALEISLARTSDGVWFGLHDATLDRTSGVTGVTAASKTWAQVQAYSISVVPAGQAARPYMRLDELIAAYYRTHVFFIDPKAALSYRTELLNYLKTLPGYQDRIVAKYYGVEGNAAGTTGWAADARAAGLKTWGYFYDADVPNLPTYQGRWDILGMDYGALAASWTAVNSYGKPVIAHILPSAAARTTARSYGAKGFMVSAPPLIPPT